MFLCFFFFFISPNVPWIPFSRVNSVGDTRNPSRPTDLVRELIVRMEMMMMMMMMMLPTRVLGVGTRRLRGDLANFLGISRRHGQPQVGHA